MQNFLDKKGLILNWTYIILLTSLLHTYDNPVTFGALVSTILIGGA